MGEIDPVAEAAHRPARMKYKRHGFEKRLITRALDESGVHPLDIANSLGVSPAFVKVVRDEDSISPSLVSKTKAILSGKFYLLTNFLLDAITEEKIRAMSAYQLVGMASMLFDKARLADGLSTQNLSVRTQGAALSGELLELKTLKDKLVASLTARGGTSGGVQKAE